MAQRNAIIMNESVLEQTIQELKMTEQSINEMSQALRGVNLPYALDLQGYRLKVEKKARELKKDAQKTGKLAGCVRKTVQGFISVERDISKGTDDITSTANTAMSQVAVGDSVAKEVDSSGNIRLIYPDGRIETIYETGWKYTFFPDGMEIHESGDGIEKETIVPISFSDGTTGYVYTQYDQYGTVIDQTAHKIEKSEYFGEYDTMYITMDGTYEKQGTKLELREYYDNYAEISREKTYELAEQDLLWQSDESKRVIEQQIELFSNEFSEENWKKCKTQAEQDEFLKKLYRKVCEINGTNANAVVFKAVHANNADEEVIDKTIVTESEWVGLPIGAGSVGIGKLKEVEKNTSLGYGVLGAYNHENKTLVIRVSPDRTYAEIANTLVHESRHQLQRELVDGKVKKDYKVDKKYINTLREEFKKENIINDKSNHENVKKEKTEGIYAELESYGIKGEYADPYVDNYILRELYRTQQFEVDAWMTGYEIEDAINEMNGGRS